MKCESKNYGAQIKVSRYKCSSSVNYARKHMSVITVKKDRVEIESHLRERGDLKVVIIGCDKCAKTSNTGGTEQVREMKKQLRDRGFMLRDVEGLVDAVEEGLCDPKAVPERLAPLKSHDSYQLLVLACGAGLLCARNTLPGMRIAQLDEQPAVRVKPKVEIEHKARKQESVCCVRFVSSYIESGLIFGAQPDICPEIQMKRSDGYVLEPFLCVRDLLLS